jgi:very-short-patch-repair endonuclease
LSSYEGSTYKLPSSRTRCEAEGGYHVAREAADRRRQRWLEREGFRVVRASAELVLRDTAAALRCISAAL